MQKREIENLNMQPCGYTKMIQDGGESEGGPSLGTLEAGLVSPPESRLALLESRFLLAF